MPDKKTSKDKTISQKVGVIESKSQRFERLATSRTKSVLNSIRILGNCGNKTNYEYNQEQADKILDTIQEALNIMSEKFTDIKNEIREFKL